MNEQEIEILKRKQELCRAYPSVNSTDLGRRIQKLVADNVEGWTFHEGKRHRSEWGTRDDSPLTREDFLRTKNADGSWHRNDLLCTFDGMIDVSLETTAEGDLIKIQVGEGEGFSGRWQGLRCIIYVKGPWWTLKEFQDHIESSFLRLAMVQEQREESRRRAARTEEIYHAILAGTYQVNMDDDDE